MLKALEYIRAKDTDLLKGGLEKKRMEGERMLDKIRRDWLICRKSHSSAPTEKFNSSASEESVIYQPSPLFI